MRKGQLISFEGLDGAGKTTQLELLAGWLRGQDIAYIQTREPGGTSLGAEIRHLLFGRPELTITPLAEAFLFQADRAQHFSSLILPALEAGKIVITDRCLDSSIAYQGAARKVGEELVKHLSLIATQEHVPDLTILLDLDPLLVNRRTAVDQDKRSIREAQSRFDRETEQFHRRLREAFLRLAQAEPERIKVIDASLPPEQIHQKVLALVIAQLDKK
ncbi:dTMP kinase [Ktedonosporobacter rubrisoli]|uniref:Thymidylate kinase n=1 Tax=Ktedonosporobacter rubrisoli TaxID=2509675 RepID=A0A4P6K2N0_KTERU|nr:dTMP kinase [Ktedonosporobacter rubrisoli]QBD82477.1 dTMP kinase [Ktedonosporobacter rubrisoli]